MCLACGRQIAWRRKWKDCWEEVRYCSTACRSRKPGAEDRKLEEAIVRLLERRAAGATICPGEAARLVFAGETWRERMEDVRRAARRLVARGAVEIVQRGRVVAPSVFKGPIRLRLRDGA